MDEHLFEPGEREARSEEAVVGVRRLVRPNREQMELRASDLESLLPADHPARAVWEFVESVDLGPLYESVRSVEGGAGRPATDPRIYLALWLYATVEGVGSARALARLCEQHDAYRWICGGVSVNHHSLSDFRVGHVAFLDRLLTDSVAVLMKQGAVELKRVAQDGMRVRANAGAASFRRGTSLTKCLRQAEQQVERLRRELEEDPEATSRRQKAARQRAAEERHRRVEAALAELPKVAAKKKPAERDRARVSTTDPEAQVMKMADGGFRPAYNAQLSVDTASQIVVGVEISPKGNDPGHLVPMTEQLRSRYGKVPEETLVDGGFAGHADILGADALGTTVYAPVTAPRDPGRDPHRPLPGDPPAIAAWRERMATAEARQIYRQRASTVECVNALARQRGLRQLPVRGVEKGRAILLWIALAHNLMRSRSLAAAVPAAA